MEVRGHCHVANALPPGKHLSVYTNQLPPKHLNVYTNQLPQNISIFISKFEVLFSPVLRERDRFEYPGFRLEDNVKMDLKGKGMGVIDWIDVAQDRGDWRALVNAVMNFLVP